MARWLRALAPLVEDLGLITDGSSQPFITPVLGDLMPLWAAQQGIL